MMRRPVITMLIPLLSMCLGCSPNQLNSEMAAWEGSHIDEVTSAWGAPSQCDASDGQKICAWRNPGSIDADQHTLPPEIAVHRVLPRPTCITMFAFDQSDHVTGWRWRGNRCGTSTIVARAQ